MPGLVPTPTDRHDYYPIPYGVRALSWTNTANAFGTQPLLDLQDVSDWSALIIRANGLGNPANAGVWTVNWFHDPQGTLDAGNDQIVVPPQTLVKVALAVKAPYVQILGASITGAGSFPLGAWIGVSSASVADHAVNAVLVSVNGTSVGAGVTRNDTPGVIVSGPATLAAAMPGNPAAWSATLTATAPDNTTKFLAQLHGTTNTPALVATVSLPPWPLNVAMTNADTAAHGVQVGLTIAR